MSPLFPRKERESQAEVQLRQLESHASRLLVTADEEVRSSAEELEFLRASSGEVDAAKFGAALDVARAQLAEAFHLRQLLDDHVPDSAAERDAWCRRIIQLSEAVLQGLREQGEAFERLRAIEQDVPAVMDGLRAQLAEISGRLEGAASVIGHLEASYDEAVVATGRDHANQAAKLLTLAGRAIEAGERRIGTGAQSGAPDTVAAARAALARADQLLDRLDALEGDLVAAQVELTELALRGSQVSADLASLPQLDEATATARTELNVMIAGIGGELSRDPMTELTELREVIARAERPLLARRDAIARTQAASQALAGELKQARDYMRWVEDFALSRRMELGPQARTRLSEAGQHVQLAEVESDPVKALGLAQRASQLATEAWNLAHADADRGPAAWGSGRNGSGGNDSGKTTAIAVGAAVGGLLLGSLGGRGWGLGSFDLDDLFD